MGWGSPGCSVVQNLPVNAGDAGHVGLIPGSGRSPEGEMAYPLQYSSLGNPTDRAASGYSPWRYKQSDTIEHTHTHTHIHTRAHIHTHVRMHTHTHMQTHKYTCTCAHAHVHTCTCAHIHTCAHALMHTYTHSHMHTCTHTNIHTQAGLSSCNQTKMWDQKKGNHSKKHSELALHSLSLTSSYRSSTLISPLGQQGDPSSQS